ncbi:CpsD/CapB family tyrosine-protein kinase [Aureimonas sp. AU40]|uniref:CpsD/CapB family tyrosine-protein kinase n=1 Tax=Aureimonas sp. AU40 TaxID=1637747 RepID=UPI0009EAF288|nr:CpsD/CapB family tyrosine-protein kinase [Aureimonas sp. AU40]
MMDSPRTNLLKARPRGLLPAPGMDEEGSVDRTDIGQAQVRQAWRALRSIPLEPSRLSDRRIVTLERRDPAHVAFDIMRTRMLKTMGENNWRRVGVTSPTAGCGKTMVCANLAFSLAHHLECRVALLDLDLRRTSLADLFGVGQAPSMARFLQGRSAVEDVFLRHADNLALGLNGCTESFTTEILHGRQTGSALETLERTLEPDIMLIDLPPQRTSDELLAFLPHLDCILLVAAAGVSTLSEIDTCERELVEESHLLGVVLNKCHEPGGR